MAEPVASLLRRSLERLAADVPAGYDRLVDVLGELAVAFDVDGERFLVRRVLAPADPARGRGRRALTRPATAPTTTERVEVVEGPHAGPTPAEGLVRVATDRAAIGAVLDALLTLPEAVESGRVQVVGRLDDLLTAHDALLAYAHASVRAPSAASLRAALGDVPTGGGGR